MRQDLDDAALRRYLLGLLPEAEAEGLEEAYLVRPEVWERVRGVEDDLLDDYVADRLSQHETDAFEGRYLSSPPLRDRVVAARALRLAMAAGGRVPGARVATARPTRVHIPLVIAATLLLAVVAFWIWPKRLPEVTARLTPPTSAARPEASPPPPATPAGSSDPSEWTAPPRKPATSSLILALSPVLLRGQEGPTRPRIPAGTDTVVLELEGDPALLPPAAVALEVSVKSVGGAQVWRGEGRRASDARRPSLLASARVPAARLVPDDYLVALSARGSGEGALYSYFFRVGR